MSSLLSRTRSGRRFGRAGGARSKTRQRLSSSFAPSGGKQKDAAKLKSWLDFDQDLDVIDDVEEERTSAASPQRGEAGPSYMMDSWTSSGIAAAAVNPLVSAPSSPTSPLPPLPYFASTTPITTPATRVRHTGLDCAPRRTAADSRAAHCNA